MSFYHAERFLLVTAALLKMNGYDLNIWDGMWSSSPIT
jgi:hypothetical protein